ncbi:MAG: SIS domain-containing protein [Pseudobdellovibrio sp.]
MNSKIIERAQNVLKIESDSVLALISRIDEQFVKAVDLILSCQGKVIVTGIGKSGQIARKIASTLSSTGTPALYLHPAESSHGDLGVITQADIVIALSYGGETAELNTVINFISRRGIPMIALTGKNESSLGQAAAVCLNVSVEKEACPLNLAPTSSSTATLAMGDALAMSVLEMRGFKKENFAEYHPAGSLGIKLLKVKDIMKTGEALPFITKSTTMKEILTKMTHQSVRGAAGILDDHKKLIGIITDGDIRRFLERNQNPFMAIAEDIMSANPKTVDAGELAEKALFLMEQFRIQVLIVLDKNSSEPLSPVGMLIYQDLLAAKIR